MIRVLLVEDHPEYRKVINAALGKEDDIEVIGQAGSAERALYLLQQEEGALQPDLILLDLNLPGASGLDVLPEFRAIVPNVEIIVLTQSAKQSDVMYAIQKGAAGYLLKSSTSRQIVEGIRSVGTGGAMIDSNVAKFVLDSVRSRQPKSGFEDPLSPRELEILSLLGNGLVKKEVAQELSISFHTVATYIRRIYEKLDVQNAPAAISKAFRLGLLPDEDVNNGE